MTDWIGRTVTSDVGWGHLERLVDIGDRMAGSDGERRGASETLEALARIGARNTRLEEFDIRAWRRGTSSVQVEQSTFECLALPMSPSRRVTGPFVDVGAGLPEDFGADVAGKVVMASSSVPEWFDRDIHRREKYQRAVEAGASAFLYRNHADGCLIPTGSVGKGSSVGEIPAVGLSKEAGMRLSRRWEDHEVTVAVDAETRSATSQNVHADVGPATEKELLLTAHVDAHDISEGAGDNAAGTAMVVAVADALSNREGALDTRVHVLVCGAEELGLLGSAHAAEQRDLGAIKAVVNNDGVATSRTLKAHTHGFEPLHDAVEAVSSRFDHPINTVPKLEPHTDHWSFVKHGVPGVALSSGTRTRGRGWGHTSADTLDKLDVRDFREQAVLITELVVALSREETTVPHRDREELAEQLAREGFAPGMKITGDWPYTSGSSSE